MQATVSLSRSLDTQDLQALLPVLMDTGVCRFPRPVNRLQLQFDEARAERLRGALESALAALSITCEWQPAEQQGAPELHEQHEQVLTLIASGLEDLPLDLWPMLEACCGGAAALRVLASGRDGRLLAVEFYLDDLDPERVRADIAARADTWGVDLCLQPAADKRPRRRLLVFDMDSTLIECEVIDELAARAGVGEQVAAITARAMRGELDFKGSFRERLAMLRGLPEAQVMSIAERLPVMPGAPRLFKLLRAQNHRTAIVSGGFEIYARRLQEQLGIDAVFANGLELADGALTGEVQGEIIDGQRKAALLGELASGEGFDLADTVAVGDGANDLPMLALAGIGVAFHAKPLVREQARCAVSRAPLDALLYVLGSAEPA